MTRPYFIIEAANTHGGDSAYLSELIDSFAELREGFGIKFQAFHPETISTADFSFHDLYKKLHFDQSTWATLIGRASATKDVWLDIFDTYGVEVLAANLSSITGIKFQSSVLFNHEVFGALSSVDLSGKKLILNLAAQPLELIPEVLLRVEHELTPAEILLEFGYQAYPTELEDSGLCKLASIRKNFNNRVVFADHVDGASDDAIWLPVVAAMSGVDCIEKHVMLESRTTEYDHFSSLTTERFRRMVEEVSRYKRLEEMPFINAREREYLEKTIMVPLLKEPAFAGSCPDVKRDLIYRRSGRSGLNARDVEALQREFHLLATDKQPGETLTRADFRKATIATIIACRLKSTRLPKKALLPIGTLPSVERCIRSCLEFGGVNHTILATSDLPEDAELANYTYRPDVVFHKGDPEDVIRRYLGIAEQLKVDVIVRVTADCPFVSHEILSLLLAEHFASGADYTTARTVAVGTGMEIINTNALRKVKGHFASANYSEYMTWYFQNNPEHFRLHFVDLPDALVRDYRLTLDYPEDLEMFNRLQAYFDDNHIEFDLRKAFAWLDEHPEVSALNAHLTLRYKTDQQLIDTLNRVTKIPS